MSVATNGPTKWDKIWREGHDLRYHHMKERNQPLFFAAKQLFGSYVNAVREVGIDYWQISQAQLERDRAKACSGLGAGGPTASQNN